MAVTLMGMVVSGLEALNFRTHGSEERNFRISMHGIIHTSDVISMCLCVPKAYRFVL
jgi:hypothetical protein